MTSRNFLWSILILLPFTGYSQYTDVGLWLIAEAQQEVWEDLNVEAEFNCRLADYVTTANSIFTDFGAKYKFHDLFRMGGTYRLGVKDRDGYYSWRQRFSIDLETEVDVGEIEFGYRFRFQTSANRITQSELGLEFENGYRHKITANTKLMKRTWLDLQTELFTGSVDNQIIPTDIRVKVGVERKLKKRNYYSIGFLYQTELNNIDPLSEYVVYLSYDFEFKKARWLKRWEKRKEEMEKL